MFIQFIPEYLTSNTAKVDYTRGICKGICYEHDFLSGSDASSNESTTTATTTKPPHAKRNIKKNKRKRRKEKIIILMLRDKIRKGK